MSNDISSASSSYLDSLRWNQSNTQTTEEDNNTLSQEDFFSLLTQQLSFRIRVILLITIKWCADDELYHGRGYFKLKREV